MRIMPNVSLVDGHIDEPQKRPYDISPEPLWCEDCKHFCNADMGGEGVCDIDNHNTWYGCPICEKAELKCGEVKKQTNYDRIRNMSIEDFTNFIYYNYRCQRCAFHNDFEPACEGECREGIKKWLESEVTDNDR